jgi:glycosyltransferase involved in cell wall biosynthesis
VASAVAQDHERLDIIVVDDGSTDRRSLNVLDAIAAKDWGRPVRILRQDNRYLGAARNNGARATHAAYVAFCDDDDVLTLDYVSTLVDTAVQCGAAAVVTALLNREVDQDGEFRTDLVDPIWAFLDGAVEVGTIWNTFGGAGMLVRRDVLQAVGGFHERRGVGHEDWDLLTRFAIAGHAVLAVPRPLYHYRIRPGSMVRTTSQYGNMEPVLDGYRARVPDFVGGWPALIRGQHLHLEEQRQELVWLHAEHERLAVELERRTRYLELLRSHGVAVPLPPS